ncbi:hypothetical protein [Bacillus sp. FJAT-49736]|uniref:hypothetical protein n=1 Tax=Bacillus sp. FJAT-49736 TaxID=2833582 RepID=UPI001BCA18DE|nr:hypothetical protein [Bacillus sp. FJAT-49736]MBS4172345.1 hypothetical protein [Bacillus sp. FJAT-49736]
MEIITIYLLFGFVISGLLMIIADFHPWKLFAIVCIAWLPFFFLGTMLSAFIDVKKISNKANI